MGFVVALLGAAGVLLALDYAWIKLLAGPQTQSFVASVMGADDAFHPSLIAGIAFYAITAIGITLLMTKLKLPTWTSAAAVGGLVGLLMYATYDLTMLTIFPTKYPLSLAIADMGWGALLISATSAVAWMGLQNRQQ